LRLSTSHLLAAASQVGNSRLFISFVLLLLKNWFWDLICLSSEMVSS